MRHVRLLLPILLALTAAACARQQPAYYVTDAATGQRVSTAPQGASHGQRGQMASGAPQASTYGRSAYAAQTSKASSGRGLFNSDLFGSRSSAPVYAYQPQAQSSQTYSYRPPAQQAYTPQPATTMQYRPPQPAPQTYARPVYAQQPYYRPAQPQPAGHYAERYRWY